MGQVPTGFWPVILLFIAVPETFRALRGWMEPTVPENYFQLRPGYIPGDLDFDPAGLKPEDPEEFKEMQTGATLFFVSPSAPASADNLTLCEAGPSAAADFTDVQSLPGIISPTGFFDPAGLSEGVSPSELKRYREAELT